MTDPSRFRQRLAMGIALAATPLMVLAGMAITWQAGSQTSRPPVTTTEAPKPPPAPTLDRTKIAPEYVAICELLAGAASALIDATNGEGPAVDLDQVPFDQMVAISPPERRWAFEELRDQQTVLRSLVEGGEQPDLANLPGELIRAVQDVQALTAEDCAFG